MNRLEIIRENGGIPAVGASKDPVSGLLFYVPTAAYTALIGMDDSPFSATQHIVKFGYAEDAESAGLTQSAQNWHVKVIAYHVAEFFRMNPKGTLYVGVYERPTGSVAKTYDELELLQAMADSSVTYRLRVFVKNSDYWNLFYYLTEEGKKALDEAGLEIPFPQMDVHLKQEE